MYSFDLVNTHKTARLRFDWEPTTGTITGPDANSVKVWAALCWVDGMVSGPPEPGTYYRTGDPLKDPAGMLLILQNLDFVVPEWLLAHMPEPAFPDDTPEGACN